MNLLSLAYFTAFLVYMYLVLYSLWKNPKDRINRVHALFVFCYGIWSFAFTFFNSAASPSAAAFWMNIASFGWCYFPVVFVWFVFSLLKWEKILNKWYIYVLFFVIPLIFVYKQWTGYMVTPVVKTYYGWGHLWFDSIWLYLFSGFYFLTMLITIVAVRVHGEKTKKQYEKKQTRMIFYSILIPLLLGSITNVILPVMGILVIPPVAPIIALIASGGIVYAVVKYKLMTVTPAYAATDILSTMAESLILLDQDGNIAEINDAALSLLEYTREEIIGKPVHVLFQNTNGFHPAMYNLLRNNELTNQELFFKTKHGREVPILLSGSFIETTDRQQLGIVCIARDITERKEAEIKLLSFNRRLQQSNQELQDFAYAASHDLQEPLRKINTFGERLEKECHAVLGEKGQDYLDRMQHAALRMQTLINDLLAYSRITTKAEPPVSVQLSHIIKEVLSDLEVLMEKTSARVESTPLPAISADPTQIRQLFQNLIGNALKFHKQDEPPLVKIYPKETAPDGFCTVVIEDNGIGIDEKNHDKIFGVFQRLHGRSEYEGSGIGLAICRKIVERHGGNLKVESTVGVGSKFSVTLPV